MNLYTIYHFSDKEFNLLSSIIAALTPVKLTVDALCRKDANLLTADASLTFMLNTLSQQKSTIALELLEALKSRILLRRTELSQILQYLQKGSQDVVEVFKRISKFTIIKKIVSLTKRLTHENLEDTEDMEVVQETSLPISFQISNETILESDKVNVNALKRKLQAAIDETLNTSPVPAFKKIPSLEQKIKDEITFFEKTGTKGTYLQNVYDFLMTIVPTSVESERAFSAAGYICTKIRSSLDDETIDCLCFLRAYFNKQNASY